MRMSRVHDLMAGVSSPLLDEFLARLEERLASGIPLLERPSSWEVELQAERSSAGFVLRRAQQRCLRHQVPKALLEELELGPSLDRSPHGRPHVLPER